MDNNENAVKNFSIDDLFKDPEENVPQEKETTQEPVKEPSETTKAMSERINKVRATTERETRDAMAKELGYENYAALQKARERQELKDAGYDDDELEPIIQKLVDKRLADDPRIKRLEELEARDKAAFVKDQLREINKFAGTTYKEVSDLPEEVLSMWEKTGNLKQAYLATQGEALIAKSLAGKQNGSLAHLANPGSVGTGVKERPLTEEEKAIWRATIPDITDEELNKKTMPID